MPVSPGLGVTIPTGVSFFRITSRVFRTASARHHRKVMNGEGAVRSRHGARYNYPGVRTVYLAEDPLACFAEKMFYFHREVLTGLDSLHLTTAPVVPPFLQTFVLWDVALRNPVANVLDLTVANAPAAGVFPCLLLNPSQDYWHLKERRADIQASGYRGLRAPSTRATPRGNMVVLFDDQSANVASITPYDVEFRLLTPTSTPFTSHATDQLDYLVGEVRVLPPGPAPLSPMLSGYAAWSTVSFNH
jgi:hypothetical protein